MIRLWPVLPKDNPFNGLGQIEAYLNDEPAGRHVAIVVLDRRRATQDDDTEETTHTARIRHIEPVFGEAKNACLQLLLAAQKERTGAETLFDGDGSGDPDDDDD